VTGMVGGELTDPDVDSVEQQVTAFFTAKAYYSFFPTAYTQNIFMSQFFKPLKCKTTHQISKTIHYFSAFSIG